MKFPGHDGKIISIKANSKAAQQCYEESLKVAPLDEAQQCYEESLKVAPLDEQCKHNLTPAAPTDHREVTDLDPRSDAQDEHPSPVDELDDLQIGKFPRQTTKISKRLTRELRQQLEAEILRNTDLFAWSSADMPGISADLICHKLAIHKEAKPVAQRKRKVGGERREVIVTETQKLLNAGFIREVRYTTWLANVVLVKKNSGKWRMCVDYTDLNKACPKDSYPLPSIDRLRLMDKVFRQQIGRNMEVYVDDMVVKTTSAVDHATDLAEVFAQLRKHNMRLNPEKCVFGVQGGKFLGFMITSRGIEANPEKCKAIIQMQSPQTVKEVQRMAGRRVLQDAERRYQMIEKLALALVTAAQRLRPYFQSHQVVVKTDYPIKQILRKPELAGRMIAWSVELSEFGIQYESRGPLKAQCLADFVAELTPIATEEPQAWTLHVDGSSNSKGGGACIILEGPNQVALEQSLEFEFKVTNNQAEYEALLAGLRLGRDLGARRVNCNSDSKLMVEQLSGTYQAKDTMLQRYFHAASHQISTFDKFTIKHVPREQNARADLLSKLANTKRPGQHRTIIQETLHSPSLDDKIISLSDNEDLGWMTNIWKYLKEGVLPEDKNKARKVRMRAAKFVIIDDELFKRGIASPLLKCLTASQAAYVIKEIHQGICGMHSGARSMAARVLRAGYYWPTLKSDCQSHLQKCKECQQFGNAHRQPPENLHHMIELGIKHLSTSVEHPQTNGQAEAANKVILKELKKRLGSAKGQWPEELPSILWAYHCTPQSTTQETPYRLTYGTDAMIPIEVGQIPHRRQTFNDEQNAQELAADLDLVDELREEAQVHEEACKLRASRRYNTRVKPRAFRARDLVWRLLGEARKDTSDGKLAPTWGGPFRVTEDLKNGAYRLEELNGKPIPRTWNATHLKVYYS
uniref:Retrovirus-related Pol polyprotein from transposon opus n=1 Tax=Cajanus cajan TaxID=3821 RepID=A0A151QSB3_CAJCA|nr:Retrovirus-related Pol polyprotein from transposon opus [Cajanus cajan]